MSPFLCYAITAVISFLLGSIPWGLVISKVFYQKDIRDEGSGNIGTTNAIRTMGKIAGYSVFVLDFAKGVISGCIAMALVSHVSSDLDAEYVKTIALATAFLFCTWGHIFTPWLGFKGGKGIAVAVGCMFITFGPLVAVLELVLFAVLVVATRTVSIGSIAAALACPFFSLWVFWGNWPAVIMCSIAALTVFWAHRANMKRLIEGTESKF